MRESKDAKIIAYGINAKKTSNWNKLSSSRAISACTAKTHLDSTSFCIGTFLALDLLPNDILHGISSYLPVRSLISLSFTSKFLYELTSHNSYWCGHFRALIRTKFHVPYLIRTLGLLSKHTNDSKQAYGMAYQDKSRQWIAEKELTGTVWNFWFKKCAGEDWTSWDPYWQTCGIKCRKMVFLENGQVMQLENDDEDSSDDRGVAENKERNLDVAHNVNAGISGDAINAHKRQQADDLSAGEGTTARKRLRVSEECDYVTFSHNAKQNHPSLQRVLPRNNDRIRGHLRQVFSEKNGIPPISMFWRFVSRPLDLPPIDRDGGSGYIRLKVGGRDVPTYVVRRLSNGNWGFVMESCWGVFTSFDVTNNRRFFKKKWNMVSTESQWKEAMLYNNGASVLPDGDMR